MKTHYYYKQMKVIYIIVIVLFSQVLLSQSSNILLFDYTNYSLTNILKVHDKLVTIRSPFFLDYQNISKNKLTSSDFDLNKNKSVKKITVYDHSNGKFKLFEIDFYENGKIKSQKSFNDYLYTFEYLDTLEIRKAISKGNEVIVDSIFSDRKGKIIYSTFYAKNKNYRDFESEKTRHFYDNLDRKILEYRINNFTMNEVKLAGYYREIKKFYYYKDSIVERTYVNTDNNPSLNDETNIFNDTIKIKSNLKTTFILNNKKQIIKLINTTLHNDNSKGIENYDFKYNSKNKIISFRKNDELLYRFNFNRNGLIKKATNVPEELVDVYKYNKNGDLINGNGDIYSYKYDQYGNWIYYRIDYKKRDVPHVKTREIEYY